jgi:hypothetical protein
VAGSQPEGCDFSNGTSGLAGLFVACRVSRDHKTKDQRKPMTFKPTIDY